jgi:hypothetical protein
LIITNHNRIIHTLGFKQFEKMYTELSPYLVEAEQNKCLDYMITIENSKYDINPTIDDCKTQMRLILGTDRYDEIVQKWKVDNHGTMWDGLDPEDDPTDYEKVYV